MTSALCSIISLLLVVAGAVIGIYWGLRFLATVYKISTWWFFGVLVVPFADWAFALLYFRLARKPFGLSLLGQIMIVAGIWLAGIFWARH